MVFLLMESFRSGGKRNPLVMFRSCRIVRAGELVFEFNLQVAGEMLLWASDWRPEKEGGGRRKPPI